MGHANAISVLSNKQEETVILEMLQTVVTSWFVSPSMAMLMATGQPSTWIQADALYQIFFFF